MPESADVSSAPRILIVDDVVMLAEELTRSLRNLGYEVVGTASSSNEALKLVEESRPDLVLMDIELEGEVDGIETAATIRNRFDIPVVYLTGFAEKEVLERAKKTEPYGYLSKPVGLPELSSTLDTALYKYEAYKKVKESEELNRLILSNISDAVFVTDDAGDFTYICPNTSRIFGYTAEEVESLGHVCKLLGEDQVDSSLLDTAREITNVEHTVTDKFGNERHLLVSVKRVNIKGGTRLYACRDVTDRRIAEQRLADTAERLRLTMDASTDGIWDWDLSTGCFTANPAYFTMLGMQPTASPVHYTEWLNRIHPDDREQVWRRNEKYLTGQSDSFAVEYRAGRRDGSWKWILGRGKVVARDADGKPMRMVGTHTDLTELKQTEQVLRNERDKAELYFDTAGVIMIALDNRGRIQRANRKATEALGYSEDEIIGLNWFENFVPDECRQEVFGVFSAVVNREQEPVTAYENPIITRAGEQRLIAWHNNFLEDDSGGVVGSLSSGVDITEQRKAEQAVAESERKYRLLVENLQAGIVVHAPDTSLVFCNELALRFLGLDRDEVSGKPSADPVWSFFREDGSIMPVEEYPVKRVLSTLKPLSDAIVGVRPARTNALVWALVSGYPVFDERGVLKQVVVSFVDITDRKRAEEQIKASLAEKEVMLREIHHRVKNNLALINSLLYLRAEHASGKSVKEMFDNVRTRIRSMAVAHEILYQSENLAYLSVRDYIEHLLDHILYSHGSIGTIVPVEKRIDEVSFGLSTAIPLGFILTELVSNCLKHAFPDGRQGNVRVSLSSIDDQEFELIVADDGVGIPDGVDLNNPQSMGMDLVDTFVEQLHGGIAINRHEGTEIRIRFKEIGHRAAR